MGKLINLIMILVFIDMMLLLTGQLGVNSPSSIFFQFILDPTNITSTQFYSIFITIGVISLIGTGGVIVGSFISATNVLAFGAMSAVLAGLVGDFSTVYTRLYQESPILATIIMVPIIVTFIMTVTEWLRGKD